VKLYSALPSLCGTETRNSPRCCGCIERVTNASRFMKWRGLSDGFLSSFSFFFFFFFFSFFFFFYRVGVMPSFPRESGQGNPPLHRRVRDTLPSITIPVMLPRSFGREWSGPTPIFCPASSAALCLVRWNIRRVKYYSYLNRLEWFAAGFRPLKRHTSFDFWHPTHLLVRSFDSAPVAYAKNV